jgi:glyoxylase-like metal-dependent hydrolase (beta-lactamase superfamily II)/8-oxo-dGTP pyrophosphatase MutT (NUDIX family)
MLLREADGPEVLMLCRAHRADDRHGGMYVFPGGTLDAADHALADFCDGIGDAAISARLDLESGGLAYCVAAIRECFEEAGVLLARDSTSRWAALDVQPADLVAGLRRDLRAGRIGLREVCERLDVRLAVDALAYHSHWVTPVGLPKRFDTRFFIAAMPEGQSAAADSEETQEHRWLRPADALASEAELRLPNPTRRSLQELARHASVAGCLEATRALVHIPRIQPVLAAGPGGLRPVHPSEPCYAEIAKIDPHGEGLAHATIEPGRAVRLSPTILRVTAPNPGVMTGPGTNAYIVSGPAGGGCVVIDPGPADALHVDAIVAALPGRLEAILVTHTHRDHSPGAVLLKARTGAPVMGMRPRYPDLHDASFAPDRLLDHGDVVSAGDAVALKALHTPGHASNHLCYLHSAEGILFTGDHVMQGSTVVIAPPDGDMGQYMASLASLLDESIEWLAPGHGFLIAQPHSVVKALIAHRRKRESKVLDALSATGPAPAEALLSLVYDDVPSGLHPVALRSLNAHLLHLQGQGLARLDDAMWSLAAT